MHCATSSGAGLRFPGGRHFSTLVMKMLCCDLLALESSPVRESCIARNILSRSCPAWPTKGSPSASSFSPGASPTMSQSTGCVSLLVSELGTCEPLPNTVLRLDVHKPHAWQLATASRRFGQSRLFAVCVFTSKDDGLTATEAKLSLASLTGATASMGVHTRTPISASMARWRLSSCKVSDIERIVTSAGLRAAKTSPPHARVGPLARGNSFCAHPRV